MVGQNEAGQRNFSVYKTISPQKTAVYIPMYNLKPQLSRQPKLKAYICSKQEARPFCLELLGLGQKRGNAYALAALVSLAPLCISELLLKVNCKIGYGFAWPTFGRPAFITQNFKIYLLFDHQDVCLYQKLYTHTITILL